MPGWKIGTAALALALALSAAAAPPLAPPATPACPVAQHRGPADLRASLYAADYDCTEQLAAALAPFASTELLASLLALTTPDRHSLTRRNALRVLGRFAERPPAQPARAAFDRAAADVRARLLALLRDDPSSDVVADAVWIIDTAFFPAADAQPLLAAVAADGRHTHLVRTRAAQAIGRLIAVRRAPLGDDDLAFILAGLASDSPGVRARAADIAARLRDEQLVGARERLIPALEEAWDAAAALPLEPADLPPAVTAGRFILGTPEVAPTPLGARVALARALDRFGGARFAALRDQFEQAHLATRLERPGLVVRAGLPAAALPPTLELLDRTRAAFLAALGPAFATPVPGDTAATLTLVLFADRAAYREYMLAFVGFGADVDGLYVEGRGVLYTYAARDGESENSFAETIAHEYTHYLAGRYVFPGSWHDPGYHAEPKGWADEGLAEYLAAREAGAAAEPPVCGSAPGLAALLARREGYDRFGTFSYAEARSFVTFLADERPDALRRVFAALRAGGYRAADVPALAGAPTLAALEADWHAALARACAA